MSPELAKLLQDTSKPNRDDLRLKEIPQKLYEEVFEFLQKKYGACTGRTNIMLNGWLVTPDLQSAFATHGKVLEHEPKPE